MGNATLYGNPDTCFEYRWWRCLYTLDQVSPRHVARVVTANASAVKAGMQTATRLALSINPGVIDA